VLLMDTLYTLPVLLTLNATDAVLVLSGLGILASACRKPCPSGAATCSRPSPPFPPASGGRRRADTAPAPQP
jgi:hypothetical protein